MVVVSFVTERSPSLVQWHKIVSTVTEPTENVNLSYDAVIAVHNITTNKL